jgi:hypothetical protein
VVIAPSKLGKLVSETWTTDAELLARLRRHALVRDTVTDAELLAAFTKARLEHVQLEGMSRFNSPQERVRVFLQPFLTEKGLVWAAPLDSLALPDDDDPAQRVGARRAEHGQSSTFIGRQFSRLGRFAIAMLATVAFLVGSVAFTWLTWSFMGRMYLSIAFFVGSACAVAVFLLFDRFNLLPDDPTDSPTGLDLGPGR